MASVVEREESNEDRLDENASDDDGIGSRDFWLGKGQVVGVSHSYVEFNCHEKFDTMATTVRRPIV
jgi:hypothetical protein